MYLFHVTSIANIWLFSSWSSIIVSLLALIGPVSFIPNKITTNLIVYVSHMLCQMIKWRYIYFIPINLIVIINWSQMPMPNLENEFWNLENEFWYYVIEVGL